LASRTDTANSAAAFWGGARDIGLIVVAVLGFAGSIYTYTFTRELGIDFSLVNTSPISSLISATRIFVDYEPQTLICIAGAVAALGILRYARLGRDRSAIASVLENPYVQLVALGLMAVMICALGYAAAENSIRRIREGVAQNAAIITLARGAQSQYPAALLNANPKLGLFIVFESTDRLYVLLQPGFADGVMPNADVFSIQKSDIVSVQTMLPPMAAPAPSPAASATASERR
jgi:hypothetical protein